MNFIKLIESVLINEKKKPKKKKRKKLSKSRAIVPYGYWAPWGLPGWGSSSGESSETGDSSH
jgi:hypothetical protein